MGVLNLPELLSKNIYTERCNGYSLRGKDCLLLPRFNTRYMRTRKRIEDQFYETLFVLMNMEFNI